MKDKLFDLKEKRNEYSDEQINELAEWFDSLSLEDVFAVKDYYEIMVMAEKDYYGNNYVH